MKVVSQELADSQVSTAICGTCGIVFRWTTAADWAAGHRRTRHESTERGHPPALCLRRLRRGASPL